MRIVQGSILAALVLIAGLLFSISRKMSPPEQPQAAAAPAAAMAPAPALATAPTPVATAPAPAVAPVPAARPRRVSQAPAAFSSVRTPAPPPPAPVSQVVPARDPDAIPRSGEASSYPPPPPPPPPAARSITVPAGTALTVRLLDAISTERNRPGDTFQGTLDEALVADGVVVANRGAAVTGRVVQAKQSGRIAGVAEMSLEIDRIMTVSGEMPVTTDVMMKEAESTKGRDAAKVGIAAGIGTAIGAIAGGRRGAGIGAATGAGAGTIGVAATRGKPVKYNPEDRLTFRLRAPLTLTAENDRLHSSGPQDYERSDPNRPILRRR